MSVDDPSDDSSVRADRPRDDGTRSHTGGDGRTSVDRPSPTALRADDTPLTIEFDRESGEIRIRRETALGTYTESVDR